MCIFRVTLNIVFLTGIPLLPEVLLETGLVSVPDAGWVHLGSSVGFTGSPRPYASTPTSYASVLFWEVGMRKEVIKAGASNFCLPLIVCEQSWGSEWSPSRSSGSL